MDQIELLEKKKITSKLALKESSFKFITWQFKWLWTCNFNHLTYLMS